MINADDGDDLYEVPVRRALDRQYSPTEWIIADAPQSSQGFARGSEDEGPRSSIGLDVSGLRKRRRRALEEERGEDLSPTQMPASTTASAVRSRYQEATISGSLIVLLSRQIIGAGGGDLFKNRTYILLMM
jgi:hypothetical protein